MLQKYKIQSTTDWINNSMQNRIFIICFMLLKKISLHNKTKRFISFYIFVMVGKFTITIYIIYVELMHILFISVYNRDLHIQDNLTNLNNFS